MDSFSAQVAGLRGPGFSDELRTAGLYGVTEGDSTSEAIQKFAAEIEASTLATSRLYVDTAAGIAATTNGQYFSVPDTDDDFLILYRNNAGSAVEVNRYPSKVVVQALADDVAAVEATLADQVSVYPMPGTSTLTVGPTGDQTTLVDALDRLAKDPLRSGVTVEIQSTAVTATHLTIPYAGYDFIHPNSNSITIRGAAFGGGQGVIADASAMSSSTSLATARAADLAYIQSRYPSVILIDGPDDIVTPAGGLVAPNGIAFDRVALWSKSRYSVDVGYRRSHSGATGGGRLKFTDCAFFGGTWQAVVFGATLVRNGTNFFCHQKQGGAIVAFNSNLEMVSGIWTTYTPVNVPTWADSPAYGMFLNNTYLEVGPSVIHRNVGPLMHGIWAGYGSELQFRGDLTMDGPSSFMTIENGSRVRGNGTGSTFANSDPSKTALNTTTVQEGIPGLNGQGSLFHLGVGCELAMNGMEISGCENTGAGEIPRAFFLSAGSRLLSYPWIEIDDCKFGTEFMQVEGSFESQFKARITNPRSGSGNLLNMPTTGGIYLYDKTSIGIGLNSYDQAATATPARWIAPIVP